MHDIRWIREHAAEFDKALPRRNLPAQASELIALDEKRRATILAFEQAQARRNAASKEIGQAMAKKDSATAERLKAEVAGFKDSIPKLEAGAKAAGEELGKGLA